MQIGVIHKSEMSIYDEETIAVCKLTEVPEEGNAEMTMDGNNYDYFYINYYLQLVNYLTV